MLTYPQARPATTSSVGGASLPIAVQRALTVPGTPHIRSRVSTIRVACQAYRVSFRGRQMEVAEVTGARRRCDARAQSGFFPANPERAESVRASTQPRSRLGY